MQTILRVNWAFPQPFVLRNAISNAQGKKLWTEVRSHNFFWISTLENSIILIGMYNSIFVHQKSYILHS